MEASIGFTQVRIPRLVSDGMVLQRGVPIRIWGWAGIGEDVTVSFDGTKATTQATSDGHWSVSLEPRKPGGPYNMEIDGINHIEIRNVMVGDVWVCSGQSNMELTMERVKEKYADVIAHAENKEIRQFVIPLRYDFHETHDNVAVGKWEAANPTSVLSFSAVAYFFALEVYKQYHVPVGLINNAVGGSPAEAWLSAEALKDFPEAEATEARFASDAYRDSITAADKAAEAKFYAQPGSVYNTMVAPLANYTVKGILWYQGESDTSRAKEYQQLLPALIFDWRRTWRQITLPFVYVQLPNFGPVKDEPGESQWAELREAQRLTLSQPLTAMAVTIDLGESNDLHPSDKEDVAKRLFLAAEHIAYEKANVMYSGPLFHSIRIRHGRAHLSFDEAESGLIVKGGGELHGFEIAGPDEHYVKAQAMIEGKTVVVWSDKVPHPMAIRYAWADNPAGANLANRDILFNDGLPASPFEAVKK